MYPINTSITTPIQQNTKPLTEKSTKVELTRSELISSKDLTPEQIIDKLGIKPMSVDEMANVLTNKILDGEV